ncbi:MAG: DUF4932 domain-containing protein [Bacillota bacterium]
MQRKYKWLSVLSLVILILSFSQGVLAENELNPVDHPGLPDGVYAQVLPRMELLAGVLSQTSWIEKRGPRGKGNLYFQELQAFFADFQEHEAVKIAEKLTKRGFTYDAPPGFILTLGPLPELAQENQLSTYLIGRAEPRGLWDSLVGSSGEEILEEFRLALQDLAQVSNFASFFQSHQQEFSGYLAEVMTDFDAGRKIEWLTDFSGISTENEYYTILSPAMFPGGGYGPAVKHPDGTASFYQVIRARGTSQKQPIFPTGTGFKQLTLHEWGHSFTNPVVEEHADFIQDHLSEHFQKVKKSMQAQAYNSTMTFFKEQILRGVTTAAAGELYGPEVYQRELESHLDKDFHLTAETVKMIEKYQANRTAYRNFAEYMPEILARYKEML